MDTDLEFFRKRIISLKDKAYQNDFVLLPFLDDSKCYLITKTFKKNEDLKYYFYGGYEEADYKRCIFSYEEVNNELFQIDILKIDYAKKNYSLNHRSILGSVLGLGLKREVVGDIINNNDDYYIFVSKNISDFIIDNLSYVGSTPVKVSKCPKLDFKVKKNYLERKYTIPIYREILKQNMSNFMFILWYIQTSCGKKGKEFLISSFLQPKFDCFNYDYTFDYYGNITSKKVRHKTDASKNEFNRYIRIAFESINDYNKKENRNVKNNLDKNDLKTLSDICEKINKNENKQTIINQIQHLMVKLQIKLIKKNIL